MPSLLIVSGPQAGTRHPLVEELIVGRSPSCELSLDDGRASRRHAAIVLREGTSWLSDLDSRNGTLLNGVKVEAKVALRAGDRIQIGDTTLIYEADGAEAHPTVEEVTSAPVEEVLPRAGGEGAIFSAALSIVGATDEASLLRSAVEELVRALDADVGAVLLSADVGWVEAARVGDEGAIPEAVVQAVFERRELARSGGRLAVPLGVAGGESWGALFAARDGAFDDSELRRAAAIARLVAERRASLRQGFGPGRQAPLWGRSREWRRLVDRARRVAKLDVPVVIVGERGTGKRTVAAHVHAHSPRAAEPLELVDARRASVTEALFGHPGDRTRPPELSALVASGAGTLVIAHPDALSPEVAERLLKALLRSGGGGEQPVSARLIVTVDRPLPTLIEEGRLALEWAPLLDGEQLELPPLRGRRVDVVELFGRFAAAAAERVGQTPPVLAADAVKRLEEHAWPDNVYGLRRVAERLTLLHPGEVVTALSLPPELDPERAPRTLAEKIAWLEREEIAGALRQCGGVKVATAALLGISRPTLDKKLQDYGLTAERER